MGRAGMTRETRPVKTVLYTCTNLAYDQIFSPVAMTPGVEFVLFTDRRPPLVRGWKWAPPPAATEGLPDTLVNRYCKFFPHRIFPEADRTIYVDANTLILKDLSPLLAEFEASGAEIGLFPHKQRANIAEELEYGIEVGRIPPDAVEKGREQLRFYAEEGLPADHVFTENAILFRDHRGTRVAEAMELWWEQLERFTRRDQLSLPYVLHKTGLRPHVWDWNYKFENPYFHRYMHRKDFLQNLNVYCKNRTFYGPVNRAVFGAALRLYHGLTGNGPRKITKDAPGT